MGFVVGLVLSCDGVTGKDRLKVVKVDVGGDEILTIATNAPNIREGTRTCVAVIGSAIEIGGQNETVRKTNVGGIVSEGMICDSVMLGWAGGAAGLAVQIPASYALGSAAPSSKPRMDGMAAAEEAAPVVSAKDAKAAEKAARKIELAAKKEARLAAKKSGAAGDAEGGGEEEGDEEEVEVSVDDLKI